MRAKARAVLFSELDRSLSGRLKHLTEEDRVALGQMLESAVNKLLHAPTTKLKASAAEGDEGRELAASVRFLFDLQEVAVAKEAAPGDAVAAEDEDERLPN
jgi:glutamyl-tRNA reductase